MDCGSGGNAISPQLGAMALFTQAHRSSFARQPMRRLVSEELSVRMSVCIRICIDDGFNLKSFVKKTRLLFLFSLFDQNEYVK